MKSIKNLKDSEFFAEEIKAKEKNLNILDILRSGGF